MGCGTTTVKISYIIFNVVLAIVAITVIVYTAINPENFQEASAFSVYIVCGLIVIFAFLGGFAAIRESICLTTTCATFLLILAVLQIATTCIYLYQYDERNGIETVESAWLNDAMKNIEIEYKCCGKVSAQDYVLFNKPIPLSCYENQQNTYPELFYLDGCSAKLQDYYHSEHIYFLVGSGLLIALEVIGFLLASYLVINFRNKQRRLQF